jgi:hypothetical protein
MCSTSIQRGSFSLCARPQGALTREAVSSPFQAGEREWHFPDASLYLGSKGAIEQFVRSLAREIGLGSLL